MLSRLHFARVRSLLGCPSDPWRRSRRPEAEELLAYLQRLSGAGMSPAQSALVIEAIADTRNASNEPGQAVDLILSGPQLPGVPLSDTMATVRTLVAEATGELVLVGYAVHNAKAIFELLASRMVANPALRVVFCLDISRPHGDTSLTAEIVRRFSYEFRQNHWPWKNLPEVYYDPRSLSEDPLRRSSLHAKCGDRARKLINFAPKK